MYTKKFDMVDIRKCDVQCTLGNSIWWTLGSLIRKFDAVDTRKWVVFDIVDIRNLLWRFH